MRQSIIRKALHEESKRFGSVLEPIERERWPDTSAMTAKPLAVWRSRDYLVVLYLEADVHRRLSVQRVWAMALLRDKDLRPISWDDLQRLKAEAGFPGAWAIEIYPPDGEVVDAAPMRHLWLLDEIPPQGWRKRANPH